MAKCASCALLCTRDVSFCCEQVKQLLQATYEYMCRSMSIMPWDSGMNVRVGVTCLQSLHGLRFLLAVPA